MISLGTRSNGLLFHHLRIVLPLLLLFPATLWADTQDISSLLQKGLAELVELDVSLATGMPKPLKRAPSVATVITAAEIEAMGAVTLDDVLESVPGIHVMPSVFNLFSSSWAIRGITSKTDPQVLLLVNGQPIKGSSTGTRWHTYRMPVSMISRVEIIRGPGSAVLGADAFAGAINVITKEAEEIDGTKAGIRAGSFEVQHTWAQHGGVYSGWEVSLGAEYQKGSGDRDRIMSSLVSLPNTTTPLVWRGPLETRYDIADADLLVRKGSWAFRIYYNEAFDNGEGSGINQTHTAESSTEYRYLLGSLAWQRKDVLADFDLAATLSGQYGRGDNYFLFFPPSVLNMAGNPGATDQSGGLELSAVYHGWPGHRVKAIGGRSSYVTTPFQKKNFGPGISNQFGPLVDITNTPYVYMTDHSRRLLYAALQDEWSVARAWELTAGARYDDYSDFGSTVNPRLALVWSTTPELTSKILYGKAFRPPAFAEQYNQNNPSSIGNPQLKPETIDTIELAFDYKPIKTLRFGFNVFEYKIKGLIDYVKDPAPATSYTAQNAKDQDGNGFELEADWLAMDTVRLRGNYSYQHALDAKTGSVVPDVPGSKLWVDADWGFLPKWSANAQYVWVGDRHRAAGDVRSRIKDFGLAHLTLRRKHIMKRMDLALAVRNAFDRDGREPAPASVPNDYPLEGRGYWAELSYTF